MKSKFCISSLSVLMLVCFITCNSKDNNTKPSKPGSKGALLIEGYIVKPAVLEQTVSVSGTIKPFEETVLMPDINGRIVQINLVEGKPVKQGTLLVKLFDDDLQAQYQKLQIQLLIAEQTLKRQSELVKVEGISQTDYDQTALQVNSIKSDIAVNKAQLRKTEVLAPFDGVIGLRSVSLGAIVTPSTPLATIRQVDKLKLDFSVPEKYSSEIKIGAKIEFTVQGDDNKYNAVVSATEEGINVQTRNLNARAIIGTAANSLKPGLFANILLKLKENPNALLAPTQAIIPQERFKKVIVSRNGKAVFTTVKTGIRQASNIEIISGLQPGDTIVTSGIMFLKPGADLKFSKVNQ